MHLKHLALPIADEQRTRRFYETYFGFDPATASRAEDGVVIIRNNDGFDLALLVHQDAGHAPAFFHFGFRVAEPDDARALLARLAADRVEITDREDEPTYVGFKCLDPDGYLVEAYWQPA